MNITPQSPPRAFEVGTTVKFYMHDCATIHLKPDEQVTFTTEAGAEYDVARKDWGFYATPSLNGRLAGFGLRAVLVRNRATDRYFVLLLEKGREEAFKAYLEQECCEVVFWMDDDRVLSRIRKSVQIYEQLFNLDDN